MYFFFKSAFFLMGGDRFRFLRGHGRLPSQLVRDCDSIPLFSPFFLCLGTGGAILRPVPARAARFFFSVDLVFSFHGSAAFSPHFFVPFFGPERLFGSFPLLPLVMNPTRVQSPVRLFMGLSTRSSYPLFFRGCLSLFFLSPSGSWRLGCGFFFLCIVHSLAFLRFF